MYLYLYEYLIIRKIWKNIHQCAASTASPFRHKIRSHISCSTKGRVARLFGGQKELCKYVLEDMRGQPIKLIQVVSTSEFYECWVKTLQEPKETIFKKKETPRSFHQYSWNSEVDITWISFIGWPLKTSRMYVWVSRSH